MRQNSLREKQNSILGGGEDSREGGKDTKQRRGVSEGGGNYRRKSGSGKERIREDNMRIADDNEFKAELIQ